ncbi:hypothetical protein L1049_000119 [Liquidambar formosana]|uniref:RanBP2-type domain-containing protein n=1 Tax=Liquidambar formosana TaxID=63359 RepID=A0AAP0NAW5_LIQFO
MNRLADKTGRWKSWPGTGIVLPQLVELTTLPAEQTATNVVHLGVMSWAVEVLVVMAISYQDGKPVTGFALGKMSSGDWLCGSCQHWNFKKRDYCQKCGYSKSGDGVYVDISPMVKPGDWYCANCEAHNFARRTNCHKCGGNMRSSEAAAPQRGDWICAG